MALGPIRETPNFPGRRHRTFSPTQLRNYRDCPERYYRTYISRERSRAEFNRSTLRGSAVHKVLSRHFTARQDGELLDGDLQPLAKQFLPSAQYQGAGASQEWDGDISQVVTLAQKGLERVPENAAILAVERSFPTVLGATSPVAGAELIGKIDLLYRHPEGFIEQIEFKTGMALPDPFQQIVCRMGVVNKHRTDGLPILSTTVQLSTGVEYPVDSDRALLRAVLGEIEETIDEIWDATRWPAIENPRCAICNYRTTLCSRYGDLSHPNRLIERAEDRS